MMEYYRVLSRKQFVPVSDGSFIMTNRREPHLEIHRRHTTRFYLGRAHNIYYAKVTVPDHPPLFSAPFLLLKKIKNPICAALGAAWRKPAPVARRSRSPYAKRPDVGASGPGQTSAPGVALACCAGVIVWHAEDDRLCLGVTRRNWKWGCQWPFRKVAQALSFRFHFILSETET